MQDFLVLPMPFGLTKKPKFVYGKVQGHVLYYNKSMNVAKSIMDKISIKHVIEGIIKCKNMLWFVYFCSDI